MTKEDRSQNRAPPSPIPLGLLAGISIISSIQRQIKHRPSPIFTGGGLTGGVLMGIISIRMYKNGATESNLWGASLGSVFVAMTASEIGMRMSKDKPHVLLALDLKSLRSSWPAGLALFALGSAFYYGNELVKRFGPIHRGVVVR